MNVSVLSDELREALATCRRIAKPSYNPSSGKVLLETTGGRVRVFATDLSTEASVLLAAHVKGEGAAMVDLARLSGVVGTASGDVALKTGSNGLDLNLSGGGIRARFSGMDPEAMPRRGERAGERLSIDARLLREALERVQHAASERDMRPSLEGIRILPDSDGNGVRVLALDGLRLATTIVPARIEPFEAVTVPTGAIPAITGALKGHEGDVAAAVARDDFALVAGETTIRAIPMEGDFPKVDSFFGIEHETRLTIPAADLRRALRVIQVQAEVEKTAQGRTSSQTALLEYAAGTAILRTRASSDGDASVTLETATVEGLDSITAINVSYLSDAIAGIEGDVTITFDRKQPVTIRSSADDDYYAVIMPVFVQEIES